MTEQAKRKPPTMRDVFTAWKHARSERIRKQYLALGLVILSTWFYMAGGVITAIWGFFFLLDCINSGRALTAFPWRFLLYGGLSVTVPLIAGEAFERVGKRMFERADV